MRASTLLVVLFALSVGTPAPEAAAEDCPAYLYASDWPWPKAGEVRQAKELIFCYDIASTTAYVAAPGGLVPNELFAAQRQVAQGMTRVIEHRNFSFRGHKGKFYYRYTILDQKPPPGTETGRDEVTGYVARWAKRNRSNDRPTTGFRCDREEKRCVLDISPGGIFLYARFDAETPDGNLCFQAAFAKPPRAEPKMTVMADGSPIVVNGAIDKVRGAHCMDAQSAEAISQVLAAKRLTVDVVRGPGDTRGPADRRSLTIERERLALLFAITKFAYQHTVLDHDRPDAQPALKAQANALIKPRD